MLLQNLPSDILYELALYLNLEDAFINFILTCKSISEQLNNESFKSFYLKSYLGITKNLSFHDLKLSVNRFKVNEILNFHPWKTNGGESPHEFRNSYRNMWIYNADCYSTNYEENSLLPLQKNVCCFSYFSGQYQEKSFWNSYYSDAETYISSPERIRPKYSVLPHKEEKFAYVLDPLNTDNVIEKVKYYNSWGFENIEIPYFDLTGSSFEENRDISESIPIIKKFAIARPLFYTGCVRSLVVIFSKNSRHADYSNFDRFNDVDSIEIAKKLGRVIKSFESEEYDYIEFAEDDNEIYPAMWVQFKTWKVNHLCIEFAKCHYAKFACVKLVDIDDRRDEYGLEHLQPNYDVMYSLFIGSIINIDECS